MQIKSITQITWKTWTPGPGGFPCWACHFKEASKFISYSNGDKNQSAGKLPVCEKCSEYAAVNPDWLDEMLLKRRMEAAATHAGFITDDELKSMADDGVLRGAE